MSRFSFTFSVLLLVSPAFADVTTRQNGDEYSLSNGSETVSFFRSTGTINVTRDGKILLWKAHAAAEVTSGGFLTLAPDSTQYLREIVFFPFSDRLGSGWEMALACSGLPLNPDLTLQVRLYDDQGGSIWRLTASNTTGSPLSISQLFPLRAQAARGGALYVGPDPGRHMVLDNGPLTALYFASVLNTTTLATLSADDLALQNLDGPEHLMAGFLTFSKALGSVEVDYRPEQSPVEYYTGRKGFTTFSARCMYYDPVTLAPGESLPSEWFHLAPAAEDGQHALEQYGRTISRFLGTQVWDGPTPCGWNSWGRGTYNTNITEQIMLDNLYFMRDHFLRYGMGTYTIDDGWEINEGDWEANQKFPHGMKWFCDRIVEAGFQPGLWFSPLVVSEDAEILTDHPDWFAPYDPVGQLLGGGWVPLDVTHPEVLDWLCELARKMTLEWGYRYMKADFSYYAVFTQERHDPSPTKIEGYSQALQHFLSCASDEVFFLNVGPMGPSYPFSQGVRTTLDNYPAWFRGYTHLDQDGLKGIYMTNAHRYWMNNNVLVQNPDMIFFRDITENEALTFASSVAMGGGIVLLGEKLVNMTPPQVDVIQRILPPVKDQGRPLDLFEKEYPEIWNLPLTRNFESWHVLGFFNWGEGLDYLNDRTLPEGDHTHEVAFSSIGLNAAKEYLAWEFWGEKFLGSFRESIIHTVETHDVDIVIVREKLQHPQFLSFSRHFTGGAVDIQDVRWDAAGLTLTVDFQGISDTEYRFAFYVPEGYTFEGAGGTVPNHSEVFSAPILTVTVQTPPETTRDYRLVLTFSSILPPQPPLILAGGYFGAGVPGEGGRTLTAKAVVKGENLPAAIPLTYEGLPTGLTLTDEGGTAEHWYGTSFFIPSGAPAGRYLLEMSVDRGTGGGFSVWPKLQVE